MDYKSKKDNKKGNQEEEIVRVKLPKRDKGEMFGVVLQRHGSDQVRVACEDSEERMCRIPGKMRKKVWMRENDVVVIRLWDFQPSKADIVWRYLGNQVQWLKRKGYLKGLPI